MRELGVVRFSIFQARRRGVRASHRHRLSGVHAGICRHLVAQEWERQFDEAPARGTPRPRDRLARAARARVVDVTWPGESQPSAPLADLRVLAIEQYGAGPWGDHAARRPRSRRDQDRGSGQRRRCGSLRATVSGWHRLAVLRVLQPWQAQHPPRPANRFRASGLPQARGKRRCRLLQSAR